MFIKRCFILVVFLLTACGPVTAAQPLVSRTTATITRVAASSAPQTLSPLMRIGKGVVNQLALSQDGLWLAVSTPLGVYLYETATQRELWFHPLTEADMYHVAFRLAFRPDGMQLALGSAAKQMSILETRSGETVLMLKGEKSLMGVWSPDGKSILTSGECEEVLVWDAVSGKVTHTIQPARCNGVTPGNVSAVWSGDGRRIYVSTNADLLAWDGTTYQSLSSFKPGPSEFGFGFNIIPSPTESLIAVPDGVNILVIHGETGKLVNKLAFDAQSDIKWSQDGKHLIALDFNRVFIWNVESGELVSIARKYSVPVSVAWMPDDQTLAGLLKSDNTISAINFVTQKNLFALDGFDTWHVVGWDENSLLTYNGTIETRWNPVSGKIIEQRDSAQPSFVPDDSPYELFNRLITLANTASDTKIKQKMLNLHEALKGSNIEWSPDGKYLATDDPYDELSPTIWNAQTGEIFVKLPFDVGERTPVLMNMAWSPDGRWLAGGGSLMTNSDDDGFIALWDVQTGKQSALLTAGMKTERIQELAWSPDQHWLAAGAYSGKIFLWDTQERRLMAVLSGHAGIVLSLNWSSDNMMLASTAQDGTALVWKVP